MRDVPKILVVDDDPAMLRLVTETLEGLNYELDTACDGVEAIEKVRGDPPDLLVLDVMMPRMNGYQVCRLLKNDRRTAAIPIIISTVKSLESEKLYAYTSGADHYLVKPFSEQELVLKLRNLLDARDRMRKLLGQPHSGTISEEYSQEGRFLNKFRAKLDEQLDNEDLSIQDLCVALNMSRSQLYRKFTAITNQPIGRYIRSFRLLRAKEMMESAGRNVSEAAMDTGFKSLSHFSTAFREEFGFPPSDLVRGQG